MNEKLKKLYQEKEKVIAEARGMLDLAEKEGRDLTEDEVTKYDGLEKQLDGLDTKIKREEKLAVAQAQVNQPVSRAVVPQIQMAQASPADIKTLAEFLYLVKFERNDPRLVGLQSRAQQMGIGTAGGFTIPDQFLDQILSISPQEAAVRPRATVIPAGSSPDTKIIIPALDQTAAANMYGGITIYHLGESISLTETEAKFRQVMLEPKKITGYLIASNEFLLNWSAASTFLTTQMRLAMTGAEDYDFLRGDGVNKAVGLINHASAVVYNRAAANAISWADVYNMYARVKQGGTLVWLGSPTIIPQLAAMVDAGNHAVWIGGGNLAMGASAGLPGTLIGIPLMFCDRLPALGTKGDLVLADLRYYLIKNGSGPRVDVSTDVRFQNDETAFRLVWYVDGHPWLTAPIPLEGANSSTVSPFVVLN